MEEAKEVKDLYNKAIAKSLTGIEDEKLLDFYVGAVIKRIERVLGYELVKGEITEFLQGLNTNTLYLSKKPVEHISKVLWRCEELPYRQENHHVIFNMEICQSEIVKITYTGGYDELPADVQMFIFNKIREMAEMNENTGLKSYSVKDISYTYKDNKEFENKFNEDVLELFKVL